MLAHPGRMILIGFVMVLLGFVLPFLMVLKVIPTSFLLGFLSHGASVGGLALGLIGAASFVRPRRP